MLPHDNGLIPTTAPRLASNPSTPQGEAARAIARRCQSSFAVALANASVAANSEIDVAALRLSTAQRSAEAAARLEHFTAIQATAARASALDAEVRAALATSSSNNHRRRSSDPASEEVLDVRASVTSASSTKCDDNLESPSASGSTMRFRIMTATSTQCPTRKPSMAESSADELDMQLDDVRLSQAWSIEEEYAEPSSSHMEEVVEAARLELAASSAVRHLRAVEADMEAAGSLRVAIDTEVESARIELMDAHVRAALTAPSLAVSEPLVVKPLGSDLEVESLRVELAALRAQLAERDAMVAALESRLEEVSGCKDSHAVNSDVDARTANAAELPLEASDFACLDDMVRLAMAAPP